MLRRHIDTGWQELQVHVDQQRDVIEMDATHRGPKLRAPPVPPTIGRRMNAKKRG
jgi:hypothetical protein